MSPGSVEVVGAPLVGISPGSVEDVAPFDPGEGEPLVEISPAAADTASRPVRASAIRSRFIVLLLQFGDARFLTSERIEQLPELLARYRRGG